MDRSAPEDLQPAEFTAQDGAMTADELDFAAAVENFIGKPIERKKLDGFNYTYTAGWRPPAAPQ